MSRCLEVVDVKKYFSNGKQALLALNDVTFEVNRGEFVCIIGPTGCGKTTLLRIIAGLEKPTSGVVKLQGEKIVHPHRKIGMVFQSFALFPWRTVRENIEFGLEVQGVKKQERRKISSQLIEMVGLKGYENCYPKELSGGMRQRVNVARALAANPEIILMDESFSALDEFTAQTLRSEVSELWEETGKTFILVTHNLTEAIEMADRIIVLSGRPARVKNTITVNLKRPRNAHDKKFIKYQKELFNFLREELESHLIKHRLRTLYEYHRIEDIEQDA